MEQKTVTAARTLRGSLTLPPDKSISHRLALFAALAEQTSVIENYSEAADPVSTLSCLEKLGVPVVRSRNRVTIEGVGRFGFKSPVEDLDCGNSGTTMRLLAGILAGAGVRSRLTGDASLSARTMKRILDPLTRMGADISGRDDDYAPLEIRPGKGIQGMRYPLPIASAQLKSAVLLAGLYGKKPTEVIETVQSRDHTERLLNLPVVQNGEGSIIHSSLDHQLPGQTGRVPGDFSAAAFWLVAGAIHPDAEIALPGTGLNPTRTAAMQVLQEMGAHIEIDEDERTGNEPSGTIRVKSSALRAVSLDPALVPNCIDELPVLMVAMCFAEGRSEIRGAEELRHKETDRLDAMARVLEAAGESFELFEDGIRIQGRGAHRPKAGIFESEHDHRIAMSAAVLSLMAEGTSTIRNSEATAISYPGFWRDLEELTR